MSLVEGERLDVKERRILWIMYQISHGRECSNPGSQDGLSDGCENTRAKGSLQVIKTWPPPLS